MRKMTQQQLEARPKGAANTLREGAKPWAT